MTFEDADKRLNSLYTHGGPEAVHCPVCGRTFHPERTVDNKIVPADPPEEPAAGDGFKPVEVKLDPPKPSARMITPETRKRIRELAKDGKSAREIAELTGVSVPTATKYMRE